MHVSTKNLEEFILSQKTVELLERYGLTPMDTVLEIASGTDTEGHNFYSWSISHHDEIPIERLEQVTERLRQLFTDLGFDLTTGDVDERIIGEDQITVKNAWELYDLLSDTIEKAPKSFTHYR